MYFIRTPKIARLLYSGLIWNLKTERKEIYLTFDDGPDAEVTPWLLNLLDEYHAKATFFVLGNKAEKSPELLREIQRRGHQIGNHSYSHKDAFKVNAKDFLEDVKQGQQTIENITGNPVKLFRPPYGRLSRYLCRELKKEYEIVMWSLMPGDFDARKSHETVLRNCLNYSKPGSIVVLHDSQKAKQHLQMVLEPFLKNLKSEGYTLKAIE